MIIESGSHRVKRRKLSELHIELDTAINKALSPSSKSTLASKNLQSDKLLLKVVRQEMNLFENGGSRGTLLTKVYECLLVIRPTSIESERAFSAAGYICTKIRSRLNDETLSDICFLRAFFQSEM